MRDITEKRGQIVPVKVVKETTNKHRKRLLHTKFAEQELREKNAREKIQGVAKGFFMPEKEISPIEVVAESEKFPVCCFSKEKE